MTDTAISSDKCILCFEDFVENEVVRAVHEETGAIHPQTHTYPHGSNWRGNPIENACRDNHTEPHIHNKCVPIWADKMNIDVQTFLNTSMNDVFAQMSDVLEKARERAENKD